MKKIKKNIDVLPSVMSHIIDLHSKIKQSDVDEVMASHGMTAEEALTTSLSNSSEAYTVMVDGKPEMMFGVVDDENYNDASVIWMLSTDEVFNLVTVRRFMKDAKRYVKHFHQRKLFLYNYVDERNLRSLSWLRRLGFRFVNREEGFGVAKIPFVFVLSERR